MRIRGVCVWLCCAFVAVYVFAYAVFGCAVFERCICWDTLRFRRVFWPYGDVLIMILSEIGTRRLKNT